ncbi:ergosterol biosynthesis ERG4/ERG24 family-domain-containing protein [Zopfochytrium polystomum]|nr:ergosterol biosynthesis ERG4/ERG24 family-domain-containing protein [Zopfochytrium polystomum]
MAKKTATATARATAAAVAEPAKTDPSAGGGTAKAPPLAASASPSVPPRQLNPVTTHFEFMGPHMSPLVMLAMAAVPHLLVLACNPTDGCTARWLTSTPPQQWGSHVANFVAHTRLWSGDAAAAVVGWMCFHAALYHVLPARRVAGTLLRDGKTRLEYPLNGFADLVVTLAAVAAVTAVYGPRPLLWIADSYPAIASAAVAFSSALAVALYVASFRKRSGSQPILLAEGGNSGWPFYDLFMGRELNPRLPGGLDLKYFCELRPGMIGWVVLNIAFAARQGVDAMTTASSSSSSSSSQQHPFFAWVLGVSPAMWLVVSFQLYYVVDALWNEAAILTTMDITTDGFGFMLSYGDLAWVPFTFSVQARYLSFRPVALPAAAVVGLVGLKLVGLWVFRGANGEKNRFRTDPDGPACRHLKYIRTESGSRLLVSGWWGVARHINYTGDLTMALAWCLPTGFGSPVPYFYMLYFTVLLVHRERRDEHKCRAKYGKDWDRYCRLVPYRFLPYVY